MKIMKSRSADLAIRLLHRFLSGSSCESLAGDLIEEHRHGRSSAWVWRQVLGAIAIGTWQDTRAHKVSAFRGGVVGVALLWVFLALSSVLLIRVGFPHAVAWEATHRFGQLVLGFGSTFAAAWIVGRVDPTHRPAALCGFFLSLWLVTAIELAALYWLAPAVYFVSVVPLLPMAVTAGALGAPTAILLGGICHRAWRAEPEDRPRVR